MGAREYIQVLAALGVDSRLILGGACNVHGARQVSYGCSALAGSFRELRRALTIELARNTADYAGIVDRACSLESQVIMLRDTLNWAQYDDAVARNCVDLLDDISQRIDQVRSMVARAALEHVSERGHALADLQSCITDLEGISQTAAQFTTGQMDESTVQRGSASAVVCHLCRRFGGIVQQLASRQRGRDPLLVNDEYDVQYLFYALLKGHFDDVRKEEHGPSEGAVSPRMDFLIKEAGVVVELKKTRTGHTDKEIADELLVDIARYRKHPDCREIVCYIYDPEGLLDNPRGIENDLTLTDHEISVQTIAGLAI